MYFKTTVKIAFILFTLGTAIAQNDANWDARGQNDSSFDNNWSFGVGLNIVSDSGSFNIGKDWNFSTPFTLSTEYYINEMFSVNALVSINKYVEGKEIDSAIIVKDEEASYFATDLAAKFYFRKWFGTPTFDPFILIGSGYTTIGEYKARSDSGFDPLNNDLDVNGYLMVPKTGRLTFNSGFGMNIWFSDNWGITGAATGKWGLSSKEYISNQVQYTMGVLYLIY